MTKILLGSTPLLTKRGIIRLHNLKYNNTYFYMLSGVDGLLYHVTEQQFHEEEPYPEAVPYHEIAIIGLVQTRDKAAYLMSNFNLEDGTDIETLDNWNEVSESFFFHGDMSWLPDWVRTDGHIHQLYHADKDKYFEGSNKDLRIVEIPDDVDWYIQDFEDGSEIIKEKARSWG